MGKKGTSSTVKVTGKLCGFFTTFQSIIWLILTAIGFICFFVDTGIGETAVAFRMVYMNITSKDSPSVAVKPIGFMIIICFYFLISALWLYASVNLISVCNEGNTVSAIKTSSRFWMTITLIICVVDLIIFIAFMVDFVEIGKVSEIQTRSVGVETIAAKKFSEDFKNLMTLEQINQTKEKLDELYKKKFNIKDSPKSEQGGNFLRRRKRTLTSMVLYPLQVGWSLGQTGWSLGQAGLTLGQTGWNIGAWATGWLPRVPIPEYIRNLTGNPFQPLLDMLHNLLFGMNLTTIMTTPKPEVITKIVLFNPKMPPAVLMSIAVRGIIIWILNCGLLVLMFCSVKQLRSDINGLFSCFTDLFGRR